MTQRVDVCIRGAGIVGRTLALLLAQQRLRVALLVPPAAGQGVPDVRAYALNAQARQVLTSLRAWPADAAVTTVRSMHIFGDQGAPLVLDGARAVSDSATSHHAGDAAAPDAAMAWIVDVPALEARLLDATHFQPTIREVHQPVAAPLTVVCEGKASSTRAELGVEVDATPYAQHAVATRLVCDLPHGGVACQWFNGGEILAFLPMGGDDGKTVALVWSVSPERADELMALPPDEFAAAVQAAGQSQGQPMWGQMHLPEGMQRARWPLVQRMAQRWCGVNDGGAGGLVKSWVLAGDAAHTVHPLAGQGLNLGLADVIELAHVLASRDGAEYWREVGDLRLLRRYERTRRAQMAPLALAMDGIQRLFAVDVPAVQKMRNLGLRQFEQIPWAKRWAMRLAAGQV